MSTELQPRGPKLPAHWRSCQLRRVVTFRNGSDYKDIEVEEGGFPVFGSGGEFARAAVPIFDGPSVLFGRKGTVDKPILVEEPFWTADTMYFTEVGEQINPRFLYYYATSIPFGFYSTDTALPSLTSSDLATHRIPLPTVRQQIQIADCLDQETARIDRLIEKQGDLIKKLHERLSQVTSNLVTQGVHPHQSDLVTSDIPWLGRIRRGWDVVRARYLVEIHTGSGDTQDAEVDGDYEFFVRSENPLRSNRYEFEGPAVLTAGDGAGVAKVFHLVEGKFMAHQRVYVLNRFRHVEPEFFMAYFSTFFRQVALDGSAKSTVDSVRRGMISDLPIVVPPREAQFQIIDEVSRITSQTEELAAKARQFIALAKERRVALIAAAVTGQLDISDAVSG